MTIREHAEKMVSDYHSPTSPHCADRAHLVEAIVSLAIGAYNKGITHLIDEPATEVRHDHRRNDSKL